MIRRLQPQILINDRANIPADFGTPEQYIPATGIVSPDGSQQLWESCLTMTSYRWGYHWHKEEYKSEKDLIRTLIDVVSKGGNLLLNIGPRLFAIYALNS
jgi:alpha-L-fucosidase